MKLECRLAQDYSSLQYVMQRLRPVSEDLCLHQYASVDRFLRQSIQNLSILFAIAPEKITNPRSIELYVGCIYGRLQVAVAIRAKAKEHFYRLRSVHGKGFHTYWRALPILQQRFVDKSPYSANVRSCLAFLEERSPTADAFTSLFGRGSFFGGASVTILLEFSHPELCRRAMHVNGIVSTIDLIDLLKQVPATSPSVLYVLRQLLNTSRNRSIQHLSPVKQSAFFKREGEDHGRKDVSGQYVYIDNTPDWMTIEDFRAFHSLRAGASKESKRIMHQVLLFESEDSSRLLFFRNSGEVAPTAFQKMDEKCPLDAKCQLYYSEDGTRWDKVYIEKMTEHGVNYTLLCKSPLHGRQRATVFISPMYAHAKDACREIFIDVSRCTLEQGLEISKTLQWESKRRLGSQISLFVDEETEFTVKEDSLGNFQVLMLDGDQWSKREVIDVVEVPNGSCFFIILDHGQSISLPLDGKGAIWILEDGEEIPMQLMIDPKR